MANAFADLPVGSWEDGSTLTGTDLRRGQLFSTTGGALGLTARGGVRPSRGNPLGATLPGGMFVRIAPGVAAVPAATSEGAYVVTVAASTDLAVTAANGTNPRIDTLGLEVVPGSPDLWRVRMLDGTPNASPVAPTYGVAGGVFLPLADIRVNAGVSVPTSVTDRRVYTAAAGGMVQIPGLMDLSKVSRDAATDLMPVGTPVWDDTNSTFGVVDGARRLVPIGISEPTLSQSPFYDGSTTLLHTMNRITHNPFTWLFTPPRSAWGYLSYEADVQGSVNGWALAQALVKVNGGIITDGQDNLIYQALGSNLDRVYRRFKSDMPIWFDQSLTYNWSLEVSCFGNGAGTGNAPGGGEWRINAFRWSVTQP